LAFVPEELKTYELCLEAVRHDYLTSIYWAYESDGSFRTVEHDYAAAINFVPKGLRKPELCFEALIHYPSSPPGYFEFVNIEVDSKQFTAGFVQPKSIKDILNSPELFVRALNRIGMPDEYNEEALLFLEKIKRDF
jgi:hypothetical protein